MTRSLPTIPTTESAPSPPSSWSLPSSPNNRSLPSSPSIPSLPLPPSRVSLPSPPPMMSAPPLPRMTSFPALPQMTSSPPVPFNVSFPPVPSIVQTGGRSAATPARAAGSARAAARISRTYRRRMGGSFLFGGRSMLRRIGLAVNRSLVLLRGRTGRLRHTDRPTGGPMTSVKTDPALSSERTAIDAEVDGQTLGSILARNADLYWNEPALSWKDHAESEWQRMSWKEYRERVAEA